MLTGQKIKGLTAVDGKQRKVSDGVAKGLFLLVHPNGSKYWRMRYRFDGREKFIAFGVYPSVSLKDARSKVIEVRHMLAQGIDPAASHEDTDKANKSTFAIISKEWLKLRRPAVAMATYRKDDLILQKHILPWLGGRPIAEIKHLKS